MNQDKSKFTDKELANFFNNKTNFSELKDQKIFVRSKKTKKVVRIIELDKAREFLDSQKT